MEVIVVDYVGAKGLDEAVVMEMVKRGWSEVSVEVDSGLDYFVLDIYFKDAW